MTTVGTEIVQCASHFHNQVRKVRLGGAKNIFNNSATLDASNGVFDHHPCAGDDLIQPGIGGVQFSAPGLFFG